MLLGLKSCPGAFEGMVKQKDPVSVFFCLQGRVQGVQCKESDIRSGAVIGKAGGEKWIMMSKAEKAPFLKLAIY